MSDGAFEALGTRLVRGRWFTPGDRSDSQLVTVVNETMAGTYWTDGNAVGGRMRVGGMQNPWAVVVGIVADERHNGITAAIKTATGPAPYVTLGDNAWRRDHRLSPSVT